MGRQYYIAYLNYLRCGDYEQALVSLCPFSDYSIQETDAVPMHYIALNIASLYQHLGFRKEACEAVKRAIPFARDSNDQECLSFLLCWLQQLIDDVDDKHPST